MFYVDTPSTKDIAYLFGVKSEACVTIYVRTTPVTTEIEASKIEFSNLIRQALTQLGELGVNKRELKKLEEILEEVQENHILWRHQANTLAVFATPDNVHTFRLANLIDSRVEVSDRFNIKPLLRSTTFDHSAYVIALSENGVRLVEIFSDLPPEEILDPTFPKDMKSELSNIGRRDNSKSGDEDVKRDLAKYSRLVDAALTPITKHSGIPVIVIAAQPIASIFHNICTANSLLPEIISTSPDRLSLDEIAKQAREVLNRYYELVVEHHHEHYQSRFQVRRATDKLEEVARAATIGAVETLYIDIDSNLTGIIDELQGIIDYTPPEGTNRYNLVGEITRRAYGSGAEVLALRKTDMPANADVAATLRFSI